MILNIPCMVTVIISKTNSRNSVTYSLLQMDQAKGSVEPVSCAAIRRETSNPYLPHRLPAPSCCMPKLEAKI